MVPFSFAGETFEASAPGALYWRAQQSLLIADLHLEKASWYAAGGQFLPPYDSHATLTALTREVERSGATRIFCLGDSFHDRFGCDRLPKGARDLLTSLTASHDWTWIVGNHDPAFADLCGGRIADEVELGGIILRHEAIASDPQPEISGHFHPKLRVNLNGRHISRRCFVVSASKIIMPAFGSLTGGLDARHPEILRSVGGAAAALVPVSDRLLRFPLAA
jgi:DNA ligase-associated metallophosphoesterase